MAIFRFLRTPKPQNFEYVPRHWDQEKEEIENRVRSLDKLNSEDPEDIKARISGGLRSRRSFGSKAARPKHNFRTNLVLLTIFILLLFFTYIMIQVYLPRIEQFLE